MSDLMQDLIAFAKQGEPPHSDEGAFAKGARVEITQHDWDLGEVFLRGEVVRMKDRKVTVLVDDGHILFVRDRDCRLIAQDASGGAP